MRIATSVILVCVFILCTEACTSKQEIIAGLRSDDVNTIIKACRKIDDINDTAFVSVIFEKPIDWRISHHLRFNGRTVYQEKMEALKRISGLKPSKPITYKPDTSIVDFYREWAKREGYIK